MSKPITTLQGLTAEGLIADPHDPALREVAARYAIALTPTMRARIAAADDPVARQFIPSPAELTTQPKESPDPIGDHPHSPVKGLVHRYPDRVLVKLTHTCPVYCRFCFRREMVGPKGDGNLTEAELDTVFAYVAAHPEIAEVIFTGGDPLMLSMRRVADLGRRLASIAHVRLVRWHSRVPLVAPERITKALASALRFPGKANYVTLHANHAKEFSEEGRAALARLADAGIALLGQSVLLRGINDDPETLRRLFLEMVANRVTPAYLHHPDLAPGTGHFRLSIEEGQALHAALRGRLSGHAIPAYVLDLPGGHGKVPVNTNYLRSLSSGETEVRDPAGVWHRYPG